MKLILMRILTFVFTVCISAINAQVTLLNSDFQSGIPSSYSLLDNDGLFPDPAVSEYSDAWIVVSDPENPTDTVASSTSFFAPTGTANRWLITPQLNLGSYGNLLQWEAKSQDASYPDDYLVLVSTTDMNPASFIDTVGYIIGENAAWTTRQVDFSEEGYNDSTIYIAFVNVTEDGFKLYIDDIIVLKDDPSSISEINQNVMISIYPNPSSDFVKVKSESPFELIKLYDIKGIEVYRTTENEIDLFELPNGCYIMNIIYPWGSVTRKIFKN
jgi:hypothetical protein